MIEVEVRLAFIQYVKAKYNVTSYLSKLLRHLRVTIDMVEVGPCRPYGRNGIRVYYTSNTKNTLAVESREALMHYVLDKEADYNFMYKGPPLIKIHGDMSYCVNILSTYANLLEVVHNESSFPEIHWSEHRAYNLEDLVVRQYRELKTRYDEVVKLLTRTLRPVNPYRRSVLESEIHTAHGETVELLFRALAFKAEWEVKNVKEVIDTLLNYPIAHIERACESLKTKDASQQTLTLYGAELYY